MANAIVVGSGGNARLFGVEFPDVKVEKERRVVSVCPVFDGFPHHRVGKLAKIIPA